MMLGVDTEKCAKLNEIIFHDDDASDCWEYCRDTRELLPGDIIKTHVSTNSQKYFCGMKNEDLTLNSDHITMVLDGGNESIYEVNVIDACGNVGRAARDIGTSACACFVHVWKDLKKNQ